jgi:hypothetical protein
MRNQIKSVVFMSKIIRLAAVFIFFTICQNSINAQKAFFVKNGYTGSNTDTVSSIQNAIVKVGLKNVDTIILMPGTYSSNFINIYGLQNKKFLITSLYIRDTTKREYIAQTILDGTSQTNSNGVVVNSNTGSGGNNVWTSSDSVLLSGLSIQNFQTVLNNVNGLNFLQFLDCNFSNNGGSYNGLINHSNGITEIIHCQFNNNIGGISLSYWDRNNAIRISRNKFTNHTISGGGAMMGGSGFISIGNGTSKNVIENNLFNTFLGSNTSYLVYVNYPSTDSVFIRNNTFFQNELNSIKIDIGSNASTITVLQNNLFNSNNSNSTSEFAFGANVKVRWFNNLTYLPLNRYSGFGSVDTSGGGRNFVMQDLRFVNTFYPGPNSPFIGLGLPASSPLLDLDGIVRPNPSGSALEIGCFEINKSLSLVKIENIESSGTYVTINWSNTLGPNDKGFAIYRSTTNSFNSSNYIGFVNTSTANSYIDSNKAGNVILAGTKYFYSIRKVGSVSPVADTSDISNIISVTPVSELIAKPTNLIASTSPSKIKLNWTASATTGQALTYNLYRSVGNGDLQLLASGLTGLSYVDGTISRGVSYQYRVKASNSNNNASSFSDPVIATTTGKNIWYISPSGNDNELGSESLPFKTISFALQNVMSGDTILLNKGTYTSTSSYQLDSNIVVMSYFPMNNDSSFLTGTIIDGTGGSSNGLFTGTTTRIALSGLTIQNVPGSIYSQNNYGNSNLFVLNKNIFKDNNNWNTLINSNPNSIFRNNTFLNNRASISFQGTTFFEENTVWTNNSSSMGNTLFNLNTNSVGKYFFNNNRFIYNQSLFQINNSNVSDSILFTNNTFIFKSNNTNSGNINSSSIFSISFSANQYRCVIRNNIFFPSDNFSFGTNMSSNRPSIRFNNNSLNSFIRSNANISNFTLSDTTGNFYGLDPAFVSISNDNYRLSSKSPLLGRGMIFDRLPIKDFLDIQRPFPANSNPDLGAFENQFSIGTTTILNGDGGDRKIELQWAPMITNNLLNKLYIYRSTNIIDSVASILPHDSVSGSATTYLDVKNVSNLTPYYYRIKAIDNNFNLSAYSNQIGVTPNVPLAPPISLKLIAAPRVLKLTWTDSTRKAKSFKVYRGTNLTNFSLLANNVLASSFVDSTVRKAVAYFYCVKSVDSVGAVSDTSSFISGVNNTNIFYVDNNVLINGIGAINEPLISIQSAIDKSTNGDTIIIKPGKYQERLLIDSAITVASMFILNNDTSFISRTIINGGSTIPGGSASFIGRKNFMSSSSIVINGLQFEQLSGSLISDFSRRITLSNCIIKSITANCSSLISAGQNSIIEKNQFFNNSGQISLNTNSILTQNIFINQNSTCNNFINLSNGKTRVFNNIFNNVQGIDISISGNDSNFVINNTFFKTTNSSFQFIRFDGYSSSRNFIYNNIFNSTSGRNFLFNTTNLGRIDSSKSVVDISYNLLDSSLNTYSGLNNYNIVRSRNNFTGFSPRFTNSSNNDFSLAKSSPAIGIGLDTTLIPIVDFNGNRRSNPTGSKPDLGAIESSVGLASPLITSSKVIDRILNLEWRVFDTVGISSFKIYRSEVDSLPTTLLYQTPDKLTLAFRDSLDYSKSYNYRIQSIKRDSTLSDFSDPVKLSVYAPPSIIKPINNALNINLSDTLFWQANGVNLFFDIQFGRSESEAISDSVKSTVNKFYVASNLLQNTFYHWRIRVRDQNTVSAWSNLNKFQTRVTSPILSDTNYVDNKIFTLNFKYDSTNIRLVKIYKGLSQNNLILYDSSKNTFKYSDTLSYLRPTFFGVSVVNNNGVESAISIVRRIVTYTSPQLLSPVNGISKVTLKPEFNWSSDTLSTSRIIQISNDSLFSSFTNGYNILLNSKQNTFSITDTSKLLTNTNYYWRVKCGDKNGFGDWSNSNKFQTFVLPPSLVRATPSNKRDTLVWSVQSTNNIKYFKIYRDTTRNPIKLLDSIAGSVRTYIDTNGLRLNIKYYYRILAGNNQNIESDYSNELSATPFNTLPKAVSLSNKTFNNVGEFNYVRTNYTAVGSVDPDGQITSYKWFVNDSLINDKDSILINFFNQGTNKVKLLITDNDGGKDSSSAIVNLSSFVKSFQGGFLGGIAALSPNIIYTADTTYSPVNGASISRLDRSGNTVYPLVVSSKIFTTPSVSSDSSVFITSGSSLNGFNKSGAPLWSTIPLGGLSFVTPTIDSLFNRIYVGVSNKNFFAIDYKTGKVVWNLIGDAPVNASAIITGDRKLVFTSQAGTLYGFDIRTNIVQTAPKWTTNFGEVVTKSPAVDANNNLIIGTETGKVLKVTLNDDGTITRAWSVSVNASIQSSPVIDGDGFIYVGNASGDFYKLNADNGTIVWKYETGAAIKSTPTISEFGNIYISNTNGLVTAITTNKTLKWTYQADGPISANMLYINNMLYIGTERGKFLAIYDNPSTNTVNTSLSMNLDKNRLKTYSYGSLASVSPINFDKHYDYYYDAYKQGKFNLVYIDTVKAKEPVWGTFQGNFRRTGSKKFECPETPVIQVPNCATPSDSIRISTNTMTNRYWIVNDVKLTNETSNSIVVKTSDKFKLMAFNSVGCEVLSIDPTLAPNSNISKPEILTNNGTGKICEGDSLVLSSSLDAAKYQWNYAGAAITNQKSKNFKTTLAGAYSLTVINNFGCSATSDLQLVMVNKIPNSPIVTPVVYCLKSTPTQVSAVNSNTDTLVWYNSATGGVGSRIAPTANTSNIGTVSYYVSQINNNGCESSRSKLDVNVVATPSAPLVSPITICVGSTSASLNATSSAGNSLLWYGNSATGGTGSNVAPIPSTSTTGTFSYYVSQINNNGCESPRSKLDVTVVASPSAPLVSPIAICVGSSSTALNATSSAGNSLLWYGNSATGGTSSSVAPIPSTSAIGTVSYYVSQINNSGCESPRSKLDVTITNPPAKPTISAAGSTSFCTGGNVVLNSSSGSGNQWYKDGQIINGANLASYTASISGKYSVGVTSSGNCVVMSDDTQVSSDVSTSLTVPVINSMNFDSTICFKDSLVLRSSTFYDKYLWSNGDTTSSTVIRNSAKVSLRGRYNGSTCFSLPSATATAVKNLNVIPEISSQLNSLVSTNSNNYKWFKNNLIVPGVTANVLFNPSIGVYRVETSLDKFCWDASPDFMIITNNQPLVTDTVQLTVFPNPSSGIFNVVADFEKVTNVVTKVTVVDINGVMVYQSQRLLFFSNKIMLPVNLGTRKGVFGVHMDINGTVKSIVVVVN